MAYKCGRCGAYLGATTYCTYCSGKGLGAWGDGMMNLVEQNEKSSR
jgi:hypothetical protein